MRGWSVPKLITQHYDSLILALLALQKLLVLGELAHEIAQLVNGLLHLVEVEFDELAVISNCCCGFLDCLQLELVLAPVVIDSPVLSLFLYGQLLLPGFECLSVQVHQILVVRVFSER